MICYEPGQGLMVVADRGRMIQVISNLLDNAGVRDSSVSTFVSRDSHQKVGTAKGATFDFTLLSLTSSLARLIDELNYQTSKGKKT